jgi:TIR domain
MGENEDFWADLLGHIREQVLVPVAGPDLTVVNVDNTEQTLTSLIGQRLAERYHLTLSPGMTTTGEAVGVFLRERGRDEVERLYRVINDIIAELDPAPGDALRDLAAIADLRLFVSTTPDRLLAQAVNEVRFQGRPLTRELMFSPSLSTSEQWRNAQEPPATDTVVLNLFGRAASTPQYAIHEEDRLEWLHALLSEDASLPDWLAYPLKHQPMLFVGCEIPDWIGRFLLRMSSNTRLWLESKQFFFVGSSTSHEPSLASFFATYCRKAQVQQLEMAPAAFVAELRARWEEQSAARPPAAVGAAPAPAPDTPTIFISYMREDADAARRLYDAITGLGGDVWLDERRIRPGDAWEREILTAIRQTIRLFIPVISANTEREEEGYVFREWNEAVERSRSIPRRRFIVPVIVDEDHEGDPSRYRQVPDDFMRLDFGHAPAGDPDAELLTMLTAEIRAMRRAAAA